MNRVTPLTLLLGVSMLVMGCSGQESSVSQGRGGGDGGDEFARFSLNITDAPVDGVAEVWVQITGYALQPAVGEAIEKDIVPVQVNLLSQQGNNSFKLVDREALPAGDYSWLRLHVTASIDGIIDSYVTELGGGISELNIPSGSQTGLKINTPFTLSRDVETSKTIDFDLRKSLVLTGNGKYQLRPSLRLVDDAQVGSIRGVVDVALISSPLQCSDPYPDTGNAVYIYPGFDAVPEDLNNTNIHEVVTANVIWRAEFGDYVYEVGFLDAGAYTLALTCQADLDNPTSKDSIIFVRSENITVVAGGAGPEPEIIISR